MKRWTFLAVPVVLALMGCENSDPTDLPADPEADVSVALEVEEVLTVGEEATVTAVLHNEGPSFIQDAQVQVRLDTDAGLSAATSPRGGSVSVSDNRIMWAGFFLGAGVSVELEFGLTPQQDGPLTLTIQHDPPSFDPDPSNNTSAVTVEVTAGN